MNLELTPRMVKFTQGVTTVQFSKVRHIEALIVYLDSLISGRSGNFRLGHQAKTDYLCIEKLVLGNDYSITIVSVNPVSNATIVVTQDDLIALRERLASSL